MVIEQFLHGPEPVYARFREKGRCLPEGVEYVDSWVDLGSGRCFQLMKAESRGLLDKWIANWSDLVAFEVSEVVTSAEAQSRNA